VIEGFPPVVAGPLALGAGVGAVQVAFGAAQDLVGVVAVGGGQGLGVDSGDPGAGAGWAAGADGGEGGLGEVEGLGGVAEFDGLDGE
jgi:hypothetical protein